VSAQSNLLNKVVEWKLKAKVSCMCFPFVFKNTFCHHRISIVSALNEFLLGVL